jgi:hypothetical protein
MKMIKITANLLALASVMMLFACGSEKKTVTLLEEYEKNPQGDINSLARTVVDQNGWTTDVDKLIQTNEIIGAIDKSYNDLVKEKCNSGISTEVWMRKNIVKAASEVGLNDEEQANVVEIVTEAIEINNNETLENID